MELLSGEAGWAGAHQGTVHVTKLHNVADTITFPHLKEISLRMRNAILCWKGECLTQFIKTIVICKIKQMKPWV